jgi:hypothetical protein
LGHRVRVVLFREDPKDFEETFERERFVGHCRDSSLKEFGEKVVVGEKEEKWAEE